MDATRVRNVMVIVNGDDLHHDLLGAARVFRELATEAGFVATAAMGMGRFIGPMPRTAAADVFLLYTAGGQFGTAQQRALASLVAGGTGLVAIHCSNVLGNLAGALDPADRPMYELLGTRFLSHGPGHHEGMFEVSIVGDHEITAGVGDFTLFDEYYDIEFADGDVQVIAQRADSPAPVMYTRTVGAGRVCYLALGHDMRTWGQPPFRALVRRALAWAAPVR